MVRSLLVAIAMLGVAIDASGQDALSETLFGYQHDTSPAGEIPSADLMSLALPALADEEPPCDGVPIEGEFVLDRDVSCTVRLAAYATLDLNGFTLQGGVRGPFGGSSGVTIKNGTILAGPIDCSYDDCTIENVRILDGPSFTLLAGAGTRISDCFFSGNGVAVDLYYGGGPASVVIENSTFEDNDIAINIAKYNLASISSNTFRGNLVGVNLYDELNDEVNFNTIADNYFTDNFIGVRFSVRGCVYGVCQIGNRVVGNDFVGNRGSGVVFDGSGTGCSYGDCENVDASIEDNVFSGNGFGPPPSPPPYWLPITDDGITVLGAPEVRDGVTIAGNVSVSNSDLGIEAPDVIDGGGNRASGNGNPLECVGVVCTPACGDGSVLVSEECDDGNTASGDGCSDLCVVEAGFTCTGEPSVCASLPECSNGIDDDEDGLIDFPADPGCADAADLDEHDPTLPCDDGADNDGDGKADFLAAGSGDPGCASPTSPRENPKCQDGLNNDFQPGIDFDGGDSLDIAPRDGFIDAAFNPATPAVGAADPQCGAAYLNSERPIRGCGLGAELALVMPLLGRAASRRRGAK